MNQSRRVCSAASRSFYRVLTSLSLCALLIVNGAPLAVWAAPAPPESRAHPRIFGSHALPSVVQARQGRTRALQASSTAADDAGCGIAASDATRFLEQATFGPSFATDSSDPNYSVSVAHVMNDVCFEGWLQEQFNAPVLYPDDPSSLSVGTNYTPPHLLQDDGSCPPGAICWEPANRNAAVCDNFCNRENYTAYQLQGQFFANALTGPDQLRQRVAWALSQILVASQVDINLASWMTPYLATFDRDAFGNYRQLLNDITLNTAMGQYLNMRGNVRTNVNENYAREILQLFSVGLNLLNSDGTLQGEFPMPTYSQDEIAAFARVFTGWNYDTRVSLGPGILNYRDPMVVLNENNHDRLAKTLLDYPGAVNRDLPGGENAAPELTEALDNIFNHPNVGPFIGKLLIQKLVTSNPSPGYVLNVTNAFNAGSYTGPGGTTFGSGSMGDMQAVIAAILLDSEARSDPAGNPDYGHLREPVLYITNTLRALGIVAPDSTYTTDFVLGDSFLPSAATHNLRMDQDVFRPPTVFSYYPPDNKVTGSSLLGPEFGIQSTSTSLARINFMRDVAFKQMPIDVNNRPKGTWVDTTPYEAEAAGDASALLDDLNNRLMHGRMTDAFRNVVSLAVGALTDAKVRVQEAIYLIASSSQYQVER
jgi:uncharacterized protein (DUF1800 family)